MSKMALLKNLEKFKIYSDASFMQILNKIDKNNLGFVLVEENQRIIGVITDGDLRRYLIDATSPDIKAKDVWPNPNKKFIMKGTTSAEV